VLRLPPWCASLASRVLARRFLPWPGRTRPRARFAAATCSYLASLTRPAQILVGTASGALKVLNLASGDLTVESEGLCQGFAGLHVRGRLDFSAITGDPFVHMPCLPCSTVITCASDGTVRYHPRADPSSLVNRVLVRVSFRFLTWLSSDHSQSCHRRARNAREHCGCKQVCHWRKGTVRSRII
jgi:hypothetical protein